MRSRLFSALALFALALAATAENTPGPKMSAFALTREGDKFIKSEARGKILQIHSERSDTNLVPNIWYVDYYDSTTAFKRTEVKFVDGKVTLITQPKRVFDVVSGTKLLQWRKLKIDSDRALAIARKEPLLKNTELKAAQFWLERTAVGSSWHIRFWTDRLGRPGQMVDIGEVYISSNNGEVLKDNLHF